MTTKEAELKVHHQGDMTFVNFDTPPQGEELQWYMDQLEQQKEAVRSGKYTFHNRNPKPGKPCSVTFGGPEDVAYVREQAAWRGVAFEDFITNMLNGDREPVTRAVLRKQARWLAKRLERMADQITPEDRDPDQFHFWMKRLKEVFPGPFKRDEPPPGRKISINSNGQEIDERLQPLDVLTYHAEHPDSHGDSITFPDSGCEAILARRADWLGLTKEEFFQRHLIDGEPVKISETALRNQVRWLIEDLQRMEPLINRCSIVKFHCCTNGFTIFRCVI